MLVAVKIIDWAYGGSTEFKTTKMYEKGIEVCKRDESQKPHFIIAPFSVDYTSQLRDGMKSTAEDPEEKIHGCDIPVIVLNGDSNLLNEKRSFLYALQDEGPDAIRKTAIEFFSERNDAKTYAILSASKGFGYYLGQNTFTAIESLVTDEDSNKVRNCKNIMKRCSNNPFDVDAPSCTSDSDCPGNYTCTFAQHEGTTKFAANLVTELRNWMRKIKELNPDVVIFTELEVVPTLIEIAEEIKWDVKGMMVATISGLNVYNKLPSIHWTFLTFYTKYLIQGTSDGTYMGSNTEYLEYIPSKIKKYCFEDINTAGAETLIDIEYTGLGYILSFFFIYIEVQQE